MNQQHTTIDGVQIGVTEHNVARITALFRELREGLERFLRSCLRGSTEQAAEEAEELAQETYVRLIEHRHRQEDSDWEALMWCTARNLLKNKVEQHQTRRASMMQIETEDHRTPETSWTEHQMRAAIQRAIDELPPQQRIVLTRHSDGQTFDRIAQDLGIHERTCRREFQRAILEIRRKIGLGRT